MKIQTLNGAIAALHFEWQLCAAEQRAKLHYRRKLKDQLHADTMHVIARQEQ